ncbi:glycine zipper 2TM domain-containing protein [Saccharophagus degradans]|uniref:glycine zipper 2TM domain-containing protein n=1 Tax=Saccharophagus degradans TaxID=86304 RepID=UPI002477D9F7|nr:glycine zipper 2TM domain-containing protein [Saccharophagus degradans]WGO99213.1 glycine zipper 2TM domain-containing protein [Saccharophagus degradans]
MKKSSITKVFMSVTAMATACVFSSSTLAERNQHVDFAKVISSTPIYETVERSVPEEHCWVETVREEHRGGKSSATPTLVGGIVGGVIGNAVGKGSDNKKIGAVVGSILGMSVANDISKRNGRGHHTEVNYRDVERCEVRYHTRTERQLQGYDVVYKYHGKRYTTFMQREPGDRLEVAVSITPRNY